ncbi:trypsin-like peptidase domain-containing protein [Ruminococcus sp. Marseille-P6503]|uniref:S1C family serine protease n=1 Tax=Ruminococcus sp. Marseille-P6503 TaxID=2364796 RepID=UPI000F54039B|nr:trypsin-like peptidase domain-containing protein [Ruminococcus sp. Marseille-P6503]
MDNFNNYNNDNFGNHNEQKDFQNYNSDTVNEFSYKPENKKSKGRKILTGIIAVLSVVAIGTTSIVGYSLITGTGIGKDDSGSSVQTSNNNKSSADKASSSSSVDRSNLPSIIQLATPSDAMTIPDIVEKVSPSVVGISCMTSSGTVTGTGIIMSSDGYIITNAHVVDGAATISVVLPSSYSDESSESGEDETITAELVGKDSQTDLAVVKIDKTGLTAAEFGTSSEIKVGEVSIVIGNPLGFDLANSVTAGIISATDRTLTIEDRTMNLIQTDASINSGNSGGPLINAYGQVIGITSAKVSSTYGEGLGFAIPIDEATPIIDDLIQHGYVTGRPTLGISGENVTDVYSQYYDIPKGFFVRSVESGSAAEEAGIEVNDIVIGIEGNLIESIEEFNEIKEKYKAGDKITVSVYRDGEIIDKEVTLGEAIDKDDDEDQQQSYDNYDSYRQFFNQYGGY